MKHEYLFTSLEKFEQVKEYLPDKVQRKIYKIENGNLKEVTSGQTR